MQRLNLRVYGRVQGVGFRAYVLNKARELGLAGFVKNMPDGTVFIDAQGEEEALNKLIEYVKIGPSMSRVEKVEIERINQTLNTRDFIVTY
ncbi:acylphosphatase [Calditerrivibrio nitroreducens]|uniref:Acylphosphatase n=1 Tax=Calditerrivibrio nitroreducens (strain DSM 19672 / NBRC 101217 / Yu37-1) TaxID=768670 RepID=E4TJN7_CALNY|nr:acylphosphatase [Calditerrivibrio nitroreducens]ADR18199.1 acylphosphatase [Calditerrivibrio nitroreducens DSM 19672]